MTIKRKSNQRTNLGIVVAGASSKEAESLFNAVALGNSAVGMRSLSGNTFVTHASSDDIYNPQTGEADLTAESGSFVAEASTHGEHEVLTAHYTVCTDGCGSHIYSESEAHFCPSCSAELPELTDDELLDLASESYDEEHEEHAEVEQETVYTAVAATIEEARDDFLSIFQDGGVAYRSESGSLIVSESTNVNFEPLLGIENVELDLDMQVEAGADAPASAHVYQCAGECGQFTVTSSDESIICAHCGGGLIEPKDLDSESATIEELENELFSLSGDDEEDEDEDEEDDGFGEDNLDDFGDDLDDLDEEDEEDEEDEDLESDSSDDDLDEDLDDDVDLEDDFDLDDEEDDLESDSGSSKCGDDEDEDEEDASMDDDEGDYQGLELEENDEDLESESNVVDEIEFDLLTALSAADDFDPKAFAVVATGKLEREQTWTAFYKRTPVAIVSESAVIKDANLHGLFNSPRFGEAVLAAIANDGVDAAMADFKFERINPEVNIDHVVEKQLIERAEARVTEAQESYVQQQEESKQRLATALATASMCINRGLFTGVKNPTMGRLITALSAAGMSNAEELVMEAFASTSDNYNEILISQAMTILGKSVDAQNELAAMAANATFVGIKTHINTVEDRLTTLHERPKAPAQSQMESQSSSQGSGRWQSLLDAGRSSR